MDDVVVREVPCPACARVADCARRATGARLGSSQRRMLLDIDEPLVLLRGIDVRTGEPMDDRTRSALKNHAYRLRRVGLVTVSQDARRESKVLAFIGKEWARALVVRRTALGEHVVRIAREALDGEVAYVLLDDRLVGRAREAAEAACRVHHATG